MARGVAVLALLALFIGGCAPLRPWERDQLARSDMAWDPDPLDRALHRHIHFSKEASLVGGGDGGGGCGCN